MILESSCYHVHATPACPESRANVSVSAGNPTVRGQAFASVSLHMTAADARALAYDLLSAADHADGLAPAEVD